MAYGSSALRKLTAQLRLEGGVEEATLSGDLTLDASSANFQALDPGGSARDVTMPTAADSDGLLFWIFNAADAAENLVIKDDGGSTLLTLPQAACGIVGCDGSSWFALSPVLTVDTDT